MRVFFVDFLIYFSAKTAKKLAASSDLAGDEGFEPPITGPEPVALPLG